MVRSLKDRLRAHFNVSVAEMDANGLWQRATIGVVSISDSRDYLTGLMNNVERQAMRIANNAGADLVLSLHTDADRSMYAQGLATFHFGNGSGSTSTVGEALAGLIQRELLTRTAMHDCRTQGRTWELLRLTRMPAVRVEVGYLSNMGDMRRLMDLAFRDVVAEGILVAVKRLYLLGQDDQPTGTFTFGDVLARELERDQAKAI